MNFLISKAGMNRPGKLNIILIIILTLFLSTSCGLYDYPYLEEPDVNVFAGTGIARIFNRTDNDPDVFWGYELYYKFYNQSDFISLHQSDYNNISSINNPEPPDLLNLGFRRVNTEKYEMDKTPYPMVPVKYSDRNDSFFIDINAANSSADIFADYEISGYGDIVLYRNVIANPGDPVDERYYKSFLNGTDGIDLSDADIPSSFVTLSLYVFSYGKYDLVYNIYSRPVWLGSVNF